MKILRLLVLLAASATLAMAEIFTDIVNIDGGKILKSGDGSAVEITVKLPKAKVVTFAAIVAEGQTLKPFGKTCASLTASIDGKDAAARTVIDRDGKTWANLVATKPLRDAIKACKSEVKIKIFMRGAEQTQFKIERAGVRIVAETKYFRNVSYLRPMFSGDEMTMESVFPLGCENPEKPARAKLLFAPTEILEAYTLASGKKVDLVNGKDFKISGDTIEFMPQANVEIIPFKRIYAKKKEDLMQYGKPFNFTASKQYAFFTEGKWFHEHMVYISYKHAATNQKVGEIFEEAKLPKTLKCLKAKKPLSITLYGDSIASGANASGLSLAIPYAPSWGDFIAQELAKYYKGPVVFFNRALGGTTSSWGARQAESLACTDKPDLAIIAFGMNDRIAPAEYAQNIQSIMDKIKKANPNAEFILVSSMSANPLWHRFEMHDGYADELKKLQREGVAVADVRSVHKTLLGKKRFIDMTGNNVNHPNDFMIRVYAQTILQKLIPAMSK